MFTNHRLNNLKFDTLDSFKKKEGTRTTPRTSRCSIFTQHVPLKQKHQRKIWRCAGQRKTPRMLVQLAA